MSVDDLARFAGHMTVGERVHRMPSLTRHAIIAAERRPWFSAMTGQLPPMLLTG